MIHTGKEGSEARGTTRERSAIGALYSTKQVALGCQEYPKRRLTVYVQTTELPCKPVLGVFMTTQKA